MKLEMKWLSRKDFGTSPLTIRCASPSTIAVLPTPGSPSRSGLFFVRRESTWRDKEREGQRDRETERERERERERNRYHHAMISS